jgi:hypothetical protein
MIGMHLVEIFLPLTDNDGKPFSQAKVDTVRETLAQQFGGVTAFTRSPAQGVTNQGAGEQHDDIVVMEVMTQALEREFWVCFRKHLEREFAQDEILIRATQTEKL